MKMDQLKYMKAEMARLGNWKEVERINKMIAFNLPREASAARRAGRNVRTVRAPRTSRAKGARARRR